MVNIIICENNNYYKLKTYEIADNYMKKTNLKYHIFTFESYTKKLKELINNPLDGHNIYIIDIHLSDEQSGIDIVNDIRKKDYDSQVILATVYESLMSEAQKLRLSILGYVFKMVNYEKNIYELIETSLEIFKLKGSVKFQMDKIDYNMKYDDIICIEADSNERKCVITTKNKIYNVKKPLYFLEEQLNSHFYKINRGCIINKDKLVSCDYKKNIIVLDNSSNDGLLSYNGSFVRNKK